MATNGTWGMAAANAAVCAFLTPVLSLQSKEWIYPESCKGFGHPYADHFLIFIYRKT